MTLHLTFFAISIVFFYIDIYLVCGIWFRGKRGTYLRLFFEMGLLFSFWALLNGVGLLLSDELYTLLYPITTMVCVCIIPSLWMRYMLYFTESKWADSRAIAVILTILPAVDVLFLFTNPLHHGFIAYYVGIRPIAGPLFIVHAIIAYIPLLISLVILLRYIVKNARRIPSLSVVGAGMVLPLVLNVLYTFGIFDIGFDVTPFAFSIMFVVFAIHSSKLGLFDVSATAFTNMFTSLSDSFLVIDLAGRVTNANPSFKSAFPTFPLELDKTVLSDVVRFFKSITIEQSHSDVYGMFDYSSEEIHNAEITVMYGGGQRHYLLSKNIIADRGKFAGFIVKLTDVSNYRQIAKMVDEINEKNRHLLELKNLAESASEAKSDFLARMSHEIRTPMNAIMGMSELALRRELPQEVYENVVGIQSAGSNLLAIINDILDFSKIESGTLEIVEADYMFSSLVNDALNIIRMRLIEKPVQFVVNIDRNIPSLLTGDEIRIRQVLLNLLINAVKYTGEGFIALTITGDFSEDGEIVTLTIEVSDSGTGIKSEDMDRLFGDFVQLDQMKNKGIEGTGLGLAICRSLCLAMGGDITVRSEYGSGSTFTAVLPQKIANGEPFAAVDNPGEKSVLLYEVRQLYRDSVARSLDNLGVRCESVDNVQSLLDNLDKFPYVFISSFVYSSIKPILDKLEKPPKLVLLSDVSESFAPKDARTLHLPAYAYPIANALNNIYEEIGPHTANITFIAPDISVLIVDDVTANLKVAEGLMSSYGMQISVCKSGAEAIELTDANRYDLIFMDHMMPEMDGIVATERIRAMDGEYFKNVPIIALTANAVTGVRELFIQNGMNDFLAKPIETAKLNAMLEKWIPKEKRKKAVIIQSGQESDFVQKLMAVDGLSVKKALAVVGGSGEAYENIVRLTIRLLPENIARLGELIGTNLNNYSIEVHGVKGALNNIGAYDLGETALKLETLSRAGKHEECAKLHPDFIYQLDSFFNSVTALIQSGETEKPPGDNAQLMDVLPKIEEAIDYFDSVLALEILSPFMKLTFGRQTDELLAEMSHAVELFDFDAAAGIIEKLKNTINA